MQIIRTNIQHHFSEKHLIIFLFGKAVYREDITDKLKRREFNFDFSKFKIKYATKEERFNSLLEAYGGGLIYSDSNLDNITPLFEAVSHHKLLRDWGLIYYI